MSDLPPPRILYIDDDIGICRLVEKALTKDGFQVVLAHRGADGLAQLRDHQFDAVGLDHFLPDYKGFELFDAIHARGAGPAIVYVTGSDDINLAVEALRVGASDFVIKDVQGHFLTLLARAFRTAVDKEAMKRENTRVQQEMREAYARLEQLNAKQVMLLREMNHRIGNSLQLITSMIRMQSMATQNTEARQILQQAVERVVAVSQVHQRLYTSDDVQFVQVRPYIEQILADHKVTAELQNCEVGIDVVDFRLETDRAIALGIIVTELVTNALRHAYPNDGGAIRLSLKVDGDQHRLTIEDDGVGIPVEMPKTSVGARIVDGMAKRLHAQLLTETPDRGTRFVLRFPQSSDTAES